MCAVTKLIDLFPKRSIIVKPNLKKNISYHDLEYAFRIMDQYLPVKCSQLLCHEMAYAISLPHNTSNGLTERAVGTFQIRKCKG